MTEAVWTLPTILSASRVPISALIAYCILSPDPHARVWATILIVLGVATDFLDGYLARRFHTVSELGKIVDPVADKIGVAMIFTALAITGDIELWVVGVILLRDLLLLVGAILIRRKKRITVQSNWPGKIAVSAMAVLALVSLLRMEELAFFRALTLWFTMFMVVLSLGIYVQRLFIGLPRESA